jgi:hypothetical protein
LFVCGDGGRGGGRNLYVSLVMPETEGEVLV